MTIALARRYRPRRFAELLVQEHVAAALRGAVARSRVGHGYLLTGPRGVGKTTAARILAMALNCEQPDPAAPGEPCGSCPSCDRIWSGGANLDVVEIDAASNRGVDDARDLRERAMYAASREGGHKVYIVDEAHMLTREAWNALLKILEEPPPGVVFVFATTEPQKIAMAAAPVMSRLQRFDFRRIGPTAIRDRLRQVLEAEGLEADDDAVLLIARHADGGMRDALSVLDQCVSFSDGRITAERVRETLGLIEDEVYAEVLRAVAERDAPAVFALVDRLMEAGADLTDFMMGVAESLRALLMSQVGAEPEGLTDAMRQTLARHRETFPAEDVVRMLRLLAESEAAIRRSANPRLTVETLLLRWTLMDRIVSLEQVLGGAPPPSGRPPPTEPTARTESAPRTEPAPPSAVGEGRIPFSTEGFRAAWRDLTTQARARSIFLGQALAAAEPVVAEAPELTLAFGPDDAVLREALERQRSVAEELLSARAGQPVHLRIVLAGSGASEHQAVAGDKGAGGGAASAAAGGGRDAPERRPKRMTEAGIRAERLQELRSLDPALDTAADELDLEIVDEA